MHVILVLVPIGLALCTVHISGQRSWARFCQTLVDIGAELHSEVGWIVSLDVAIMFAVFTISVGGQLLGDAMKASRMQGDLGTISEFVAATSIVVMIMILPYYWESPARFLSLLGVVPAVVVVVFLGAQLGSWIFINTENQVKEANRLRIQNRELLQELGRWSAKPWPLVVALMFVGILLFYFLRFTFKDHIKLGFSWALLVILSVVPLVFLFTQVIVTYSGWSVWRDLPGVLIIMGGVILTGFVPGIKRSRFWMDWSIQGVARQFAHRELVKQYAQAGRRVDHLNAQLKDRNAQAETLSRTS